MVRFYCYVINSSIFTSQIIGGELVPEIKQNSQAWYQLMVSILLYTEPTVKYFDLSYHANQCIQQFGGPKQLKLLDHIIVALLENDLNEVSLIIWLE